MEKSTQRNMVFGSLILVAAGVGYWAGCRMSTKKKAFHLSDGFQGVAEKAKTAIHTLKSMSETTEKVGNIVKDIMSGEAIQGIFSEVKQKLGRKLTEKNDDTSEGKKSFISVHESVEIAAPVEEVYSFWRDFENLPQFMHHLQEVKVLDDTHSHWKTSGPLGTSVEWDAEITNEKENELISWKSKQGEVENCGTVTFCKSGKGDRSEQDQSTCIDVELKYRPPFGSTGDKIASLFGENPRKQIKEDLKNLKEHFENQNQMN